MIIWIDAQLSPAIAAWINRNYENIKAESLRSLGLRDATDLKIFNEAKKVNAIIMSKDDNFIQHIEKYDIPPKLIWITCGNTSNARLKEILSASLSNSIKLLIQGEKIVEITDK